MKSCKEMTECVLARRDAYMTRRRKFRRGMLASTATVCCCALVMVGLWQGGLFDPATPSQSETTKPTESTPPATEPSGYGIGGDGNMCTIHNMYYHIVSGGFVEEYEDYLEAHEGFESENYTWEDCNVIDFVEFSGITREEFIEASGGLWTEDNLDEIAWDHGNGCPYTKRQYLDAIYGDDPELTAWVFAPNSTWPSADRWSLTGDKDIVPEEWPPEGYGFGETRPKE